MNREAIGVSALNRYVKALLESDEVLSQIWVEGELSSVKIHSASGHIYFRALEDGCSVKAVMFRSYAQRLRFLPKDGMRVLLNCQVSLYERDGDYQLYVRDIIPVGEGSRQAELEAAKKRLEASGVFDQAKKRPIPQNPDRIAVITSSSGAVIKDILSVAGRRNPFVEILLFPVNVQGVLAANAIIEAIEKINQNPDCADLVIIARGGGSQDDLWIFNDEKLVKAAAGLKIPFISAVGHEVDYSLLDLASDLRAPTPSAAAELAVPDVYEWFVAANQRVSQFSALIVGDIFAKREYLDRLFDSLSDNVLVKLDNSKKRVESLQLLCDSLSPVNTLRRGYAAVSNDEGYVSSIKDIKPQDEITVRLFDGDAMCTVNEVKIKDEQ